MEYEKSIFRVHEKTMSGGRFKTMFKVLAFALIGWGMMSVFLTIISHIVYYRGQNVVGMAMDEYVQFNEKLGNMFPEDFEPNWKKENITLDGNGSGSGGKRRLAGEEKKENSGKEVVEQFFGYLQNTYNLSKADVVGALQTKMLENKYNGTLKKFYLKRDAFWMPLDVIDIRFVTDFDKNKTGTHQHFLPFEAITNKTKTIYQYKFSDNKNIMKLQNKNKSNLTVIHQLFIDANLLTNLPAMFKGLSFETLIIMDIIHCFK
jgi:hypothetical protein